MKLRLISETIVGDQDMIFNYLGSAASKAFGGDKGKLPDRFRRYSVKAAEYKRATDPRMKCGTCKFFDDNNNTCMLVEGKLNSDAVCKLWATDSGNQQRPQPQPQP